MYISGPALILRGGISLYSQEGIKMDFDSKDGKVKSDLHGEEIDTYLVSRSVKISFKPVDSIANLASFFSLGIANIGQSIFTAAVTARTITGISLANPGIVTFAAAHKLGPAGTTIAGTIAGVGGGIAPGNVNGPVVLTIIDATTASCGINVTHAGAAGNFTPVSEPLQIFSKTEGVIYTFERAGQSKAPPIHLGASKGFFGGDLEFMALGSYTKTPTDPAYWLSQTAAAFTDSGFDQSTIKRYRYNAAYGDAPYNAMTGQEGFDATIEYKTAEIPDDNVGIGDIILTSVNATCKFKPSNLSRAQVLSLIELQDATALVPGASFSGDGTTDLVISGTDGTNSMTLTLAGAGFKDSKQLFQTGKLGFGEVMATTKRTWTAGSPNSLYTMATT